jgi:hypothetical protein
MGTLDGASSTLTAIAGAACPGALQTILNQMVIPITMISAFFFLGDVFETYQISGSMLIFLGSCLASSNYFFAPSSAHSNGASIAIYFLSGECIATDDYYFGIVAWFGHYKYFDLLIVQQHRLQRTHLQLTNDYNYYNYHRFFKLEYHWCLD